MSRTALAQHHLASQVRGAAGGRVTVVQSPPGFGKSMLLRSIEGSRPGPLVIDDVDRSVLAEKSPAIEENIERGVVLATRDISLAAEIGLRFAGRCEIVSSQQLRLGVEHVEKLLPEGRSHLAVAICELTGGWPLATFLLIANQRILNSKSPVSMPAFAEDYLREYFEELCDQSVDPAALRCLAELLDYGELSHTMLRAAFDGDTAIGALRSLARKGIFVTEVHDERPRFLVEPSFIRFIQHRYAGESIGKNDVAKVSALARGGFTRSALRLASSSSDPNAVVAAIETLGGMRVPLTLGYDAALYLDQIGGAAFRQTGVLIARIYLALQQGNVRFARDLMTNFAADAVEHSPDAARKFDLLDFVIRFYENRPIELAELEAYERRHAADLCDDQIARAVLEQVRASTYYFRNDLGNSYSCARFAMELANSVNAPLLTHYAKFYVALTEVRTGHLSHATALLEAASASSNEEFGVGNPQVAQASLILARIRVERLDWAGATELFDSHVDAGDLHANWRDAAEMVTQTAAELLRHRRGAEAALDYLDGRAAAYRQANMPICAQMAAVIKAQYCHHQGMFAEAREALEEARADHPSHFNGKLTCYGMEIALLGHRLAMEDSANTLDRSAFDKLAVEIEASLDVALRLRLIMARYRLAFSADPACRAADDLRYALRLGARHGMLATLLAEFTPDWERKLAILECLNLTSTEVNCLNNLRIGMTPSSSPGKVIGEHPLSPRELQVLNFLADGLSSKEMARKLSISIGTVKGYRRKLYEKLNIYQRSDAVSAARTLHAGGSLALSKDYHG